MLKRAYNKLKSAFGFGEKQVAKVTDAPVFKVPEIGSLPAEEKKRGNHIAKDHVKKKRKKRKMVAASKRRNR